MTVKQLRDAVAKLNASDDTEVMVWLPGTTIRLGSIWLSKETRIVMIEGDVISGAIP